jgi:hypothetical protein
LIAQLPAGSPRLDFAEPTAFTDGQDFLDSENIKAVVAKWRSTSVSQSYQPRQPAGRRGFFVERSVVGDSKSVGHTNDRRLKRHAWRLPRCTATRTDPTCGLPLKCQIDVIDSEHRQLPRRVSFGGKVNGENVPILTIGAGVREDRIATGYLAIVEYDDSSSLAQRGSEPRGVFAVFEHRSGSRRGYTKASNVPK